MKFEFKLVNENVPSVFEKTFKELTEEGWEPFKLDISGYGFTMIVRREKVETPPTSS